MPLWWLSVGVTAAALLAALLSELPFVADIPIGGCMALGFFVAAGMLLFDLAAWAALVTLAAFGLFLSYGGNRLGPYLVLGPNLALIYYFGTSGLVAGGQTVLAWVLIALSVLPVLAALLAAFQLILRGVSGHLAGAFAGLLVMGLMLPTLGHGWLQDLSNASETPISTTASTQPAC